MTSKLLKTDILEVKRILLKPEKSSLKWDTTKKHTGVSVSHQYTAYASISKQEKYIAGNESFESHTNYKWILTVQSKGRLRVGIVHTENMSSTHFRELTVEIGDVIKCASSSGLLRIIHESQRVTMHTIKMPIFTTMRPWICSCEGYGFSVEIARNSYSELISQPDGTFKILNQMEISNQNKIDRHLTDSTLHYPQRHIDHKKIQNSGKYLHEKIDEHLDDKKYHYNQTDIDHDKLKNNGRFSHVEIDKHLSNDKLHFAENTILHDNIANTGVFSHPQIDTHLRREDIHFKLEDIDHTVIKGAGKYSHDDLDFHLNNNLVHHELNDIAISKQNVWSAQKILDELKILDKSKLNVTGGIILENLEVKKNIASDSITTTKLTVNGITRIFDKQVYGCWVYSEIAGCKLTQNIPDGGSYATLCAETTTGNYSGSACIYKVMASSGNPEINTKNQTTSGKLLVNLKEPRLCEIDFHICAKPGQSTSWNYRLSVGNKQFYYPQTRTGQITSESSGKIIIMLQGEYNIYVSIGNGSEKGVEFDIYNVMLSIKTFV